MPIPKPPPRSTKPAASPSVEYIDTYGITYLDGRATIKVSIDVKVSRHYQSCGVQGAIELTTRADQSDDAVGKAFTKMREALKPEIAKAVDLLETLG
jgi:hypothetical protein